MAISTSDNGDIKTKLHLAFNMYDSSESYLKLAVCAKYLNNLVIKDQNGRIEKKEMEKIILAIYDLRGIESRKGENDPKIRAADIFSKMDKDFTNTLNETEFVTGCMQDAVETIFNTFLNFTLILIYLFI